MITKINEKWELHSWDNFAPMLFGPHDWCFEIDNRGDLVFSADGETTGHMPSAAMYALIEAHAQYLVRKVQ